MILKIGDRVKLINARHGIYDSNPYWPEYKIEGTVDGVSMDRTHKLPIFVEWDNRGNNHYSEDDLELSNTLIIDIDELFEEIDI